MSDKNMTTLQASKRQLTVDPHLFSRNVSIKQDKKSRTKMHNKNILIMHSSKIPYNTNGHKQSGGSFNDHINQKSRQLLLIVIIFSCKTTKKLLFFRWLDEIYSIHRSHRFPPPEKIFHHCSNQELSSHITHL